MSSELKLDSSIQVIKSSNTDITIKIRKQQVNINEKEKNNLIYIGHDNIIIKNVSKEYVALRVRSTKKKYYKVEPIYSIIHPNSFVTIKIFYTSTEEEELTSLRHKFKFDGFIIEEKDKNCKNILGLFQNAISDNKIRKGNSIVKNVKFIYEKEDRECEEIRKIHQTLLKELNELRKQNRISANDYFSIAIEIIRDIKNQKRYVLLLIVLFIFWVILGFYFSK